MTMGSPLGPTLANIFMGYIELKVVPAFKNSFLYLRYVDDCFVLLRNEKIMDEVFNILNNAHTSISFTIKKNNNGIAFLDVQIKREENRFLTSVYRKKTFTGCYLNFQSNCSLKRKVNLIRTLCHRAHKICSPELLLSEIKQIKLLLNKNENPQDLVNKTIHPNLKNLDRIKTIGSEKCVSYFKSSIH